MLQCWRFWNKVLSESFYYLGDKLQPSCRMQKKTEKQLHSCLNFQSFYPKLVPDGESRSHPSPAFFSSPVLLWGPLSLLFFFPVCNNRSQPQDGSASSAITRKGWRPGCTSGSHLLVNNKFRFLNFPPLPPYKKPSSILWPDCLSSYFVSQKC